ncbi:VirB2 family type IV secretion system major pilin TrwL [Bartonella raoultii]|uniref:VirB2 family type IV secretion system major pilin TrwL n=1 Tax=Bartonella raoultii TaxID=1457020 RepID=A0ABS7I9R1_9HYPH|nr:VirB2 family type IV secretion system major pilin TrwL [Bartonella raoultii]MBX4335901.1 VirB2 family type IV secretion system major pilin TrwL [Bartonella raoultii]
MNKLNTLQSKMNHKIVAISAATTMFFVSNSAYAQNLTNMKTMLEGFRDQLKTIIPIFAAVLLLCLAIGYAGRYIEKDTFVRWAIGVAVAGSATQIATMLFGTN